MRNHSSLNKKSLGKYSVKSQGQLARSSSIRTQIYICYGDSGTSPVPQLFYSIYMYSTEFSTFWYWLYQLLFNFIIDKTASLSIDSESHHSNRSATRSLTRKLCRKGIQNRAAGTPGLPWHFPFGGGAPAIVFGPAQTAGCQHAPGCGNKASVSGGTTSHTRNQSNARSMLQVRQCFKRFTRKMIP